MFYLRPFCFYSFFGWPMALAAQCLNVPNQWLGDLPPTTTFGYGPFREVRLLVDGRVAGVVFP